MKTVLTLGRTLSGVMLVLMELLILVEIVGRKIFNWSTLMADEYSAYFFCAMFLGLGYTLVEGRHVRISIIISRLRPAALRILNAACLFIGTVLMGYATYYLGVLTWKNFQTHAIALTPRATPLFIPQAVVFLGTLLLTITLLTQGIAVARKRLAADEDLKAGL